MESSKFKFVNLTDLFGKQCFGIYSNSAGTFLPTNKPQVCTSWEEFTAAVGDIYELTEIKALCPPWVLGLPSYYVYVYESSNTAPPVKVAGFYSAKDATDYANMKGKNFYVIYAGM